MAKRTQKTAGRTRANGAGSLWTDPKTGSLYALITWSVLEGGKPKRKKRYRKSVSGNKTEAYRHIKDLLEELAVERLNPPSPADPADSPHQDRKVNSRTLTLGELGGYHKEDNLTPAVFNENGDKTSGLLSWKNERRKVDILVAYFGARTLVSAITIGAVRKLKAQRLSQSPMARYKESGSEKMITKRMTGANGTARTLSYASVHRELATLRRMLNYAVEEKWLPTGNPMAHAKDLIEPSKEKMRTTIASQAEEQFLLNHCLTHFRRKHLLPYLMTAFDHGCRSIELRRMLVRDVDFEANTFHVYSFKGKQRHDRILVMTPRVAEALLECCAGKKPEDHVFTYGKDHKPLAYAPRSSFKSAKREAKFWSDGAINLDEFRGHDARHTNITRLVKSGMSLDEAGKLAGHLQPKTTWRYLNPDHSSRQRAADLIANYSEAEVIPFAKKKRRKSA